MQTNISDTTPSDSSKRPVSTTVAVSRKPGKRRSDSIAVAAGPIAAILIAGLASGIRSQVGSTNVALVLTCVVVSAAMASRMAGVVTALAAALAYNFFHTTPYHSLRINDGKDVVTVLLLVAIGLVISEVSSWRRRLQTATERHVEGQHMLEITAAMVAADKPLVEVWTTIQSLLVKELRIADCRFERGPSTAAHTLKRSGSLSATEMKITDEGFELPSGGVSVPVVFAGEVLGQLVLIAKPGSGSRLEERRIAVALGDHLAISLWRAGNDGPSTIATP